MIHPARLGEVVKKARLNRGISLRQLAEQTSLAPATISRVERGSGCDALTFYWLHCWLYGEQEKTELEELSDEIEGKWRRR